MEIDPGAKMQASSGRKSDETMTSPDETAIRACSKAMAIGIDNDPGLDLRLREGGPQGERTESETGDQR